LKQYPRTLMETTETLKREIQQMNELIARTRRAVEELEQAFQQSMEELARFEDARKSWG